MSIVVTKNGFQFDLANPQHSHVNIDDIAHGLSNTCRFAGQCKQFYSVAQHSVYVSKLVPEEQALAALLHDATEAYLGDVTSPLKNLLPDYKRLEKNLHNTICDVFGIPQQLTTPIKIADMRMFKTEFAQLMGGGLTGWDDIEAAGFLIDPLLPDAAYRLFMNRFLHLTRDW